MHDTILKVAERLGWLDTQFGPDAPPMILSPVAGAPFYVHEIENELFIEFAAYARAEMVKRGWMESRDGSTVGVILSFYDEYGEQAQITPGCGNTTEDYEYDPKDPTDEAKATLSAIAEALAI